MDPCRAFPVELFIDILSYLPANQLIACEGVSKLWQSMLRSICTVEWAKKQPERATEAHWRFEGGWKAFKECVYSIYRLETGNPQHVEYIRYSVNSSPYITDNFIAGFDDERPIPEGSEMRIIEHYLWAYKRSKKTNTVDGKWKILVREMLGMEHIGFPESSLGHYNDKIVFSVRGRKLGESRMLSLLVCYDLENRNLVWVRECLYFIMKDLVKNGRMPSTLSSPVWPGFFLPPLIGYSNKLGYTTVHRIYGEYGDGMDYDNYTFTVLDLANGEGLSFPLRAHNEDHGIGAHLLDPHDGRWFLQFRVAKTHEKFILDFRSSTTGELLYSREMVNEIPLNETWKPYTVTLKCNGVLKPINEEKETIRVSAVIAWDVDYDTAEYTVRNFVITTEYSATGLIFGISPLELLSYVAHHPREGPFGQYNFMVSNDYENADLEVMVYQYQEQKDSTRELPNGSIYKRYQIGKGVPLQGRGKLRILAKMDTTEPPQDYHNPYDRIELFENTVMVSRNGFFVF